MCRSIRTLHNFAPPATDEEIRASALQYVRKISGMTRPSQSNAEAFEQAVDEIAGVAHRLLGRLVTHASPRTREREAERGRERWERRAARMKPGP